MKFDDWAQKLKRYRQAAGYNGGKQLAVEMQLYGVDISYDLIRRYEAGNAPSKRRRHLDLIYFFVEHGVIGSRTEASEWLREGGQAGLDPAECRDIFPGRSITLHVKGNLEDVDPAQVKRLLHLLAEELNMSADDIELEGMESGSIKLLLHLPVSAAQKIMVLARDKSQFFGQHDIFAVSSPDEAILLDYNVIATLTDQVLLQQLYKDSVESNNNVLRQKVTERLGQLATPSSSKNRGVGSLGRLQTWWGVSTSKSSGYPEKKRKNRGLLALEVGVVGLILGLGIFVLISSFASAPKQPASEIILTETPEPTATVAWQTVTDDSLGISFLVPPDWSYKIDGLLGEIVFANDILVFDSPDPVEAAGGMVHIVDSTSPFDQEMTTDLAEEPMVLLESMVGNFTAIDVYETVEAAKTIFIGGWPGAQTIVEGDRNELTYTIIFTIVIADERTVMVIALDTTPKRDQIETLINIIDTLEVD